MLPDIFAPLATKINYVRQITSNEYHSSCPSCGGEPHEDGSYPDRFVMWITSRRGTPFAICRRCSYKWSPLKADAHWTREERAEFQRKIDELERNYFVQKAQELAQLSAKIESQGIYHRYFEEGKKSEKAIKYFETLGIPETWVEYLQLGYISDYQVRGSLSSYTDSAYTFPIWTLGNRVENVKLRVANPQNSNDRYRNLYKSGCQHLYVPIHEIDKVGNKVLVMEGEKKAITAEIYNELPSDIQIVGIQSAMPEKRILNLLKGAEVIYLALDPDAYRKNEAGIVPVLNVARSIGEKKCRLVIPPRDTKFDDAILLGFKFVNAFNMAIPVSGLKAL